MQGSGGGGGPCASSPGSPSRASAAVQASPGRRQIRPQWHLHLLPKCELPELGTPCCQPPRVLGVGCGLRAYESVPLFSHLSTSHTASGKPWPGHLLAV